MKLRDKIALINRAIAALETPDDLTQEEKGHLIDDLNGLADEYMKEEK